MFVFQFVLPEPEYSESTVDRAFAVDLESLKFGSLCFFKRSYSAFQSFLFRQLLQEVKAEQLTLEIGSSESRKTQ